VSVTAEPTGIRPFRIEVPEEQLAELRRRISATRWPQKGARPRSVGVEKVYPNLIHFNTVDKGGHFAAWEEPELFATELRAAFRTLR